MITIQSEFEQKLTIRSTIKVNKRVAEVLLMLPSCSDKEFSINHKIIEQKDEKQVTTYSELELITNKTSMSLKTLNSVAKMIAISHNVLVEGVKVLTSVFYDLKGTLHDQKSNHKAKNRQNRPNAKRTENDSVVL